MEGIAKIDVLLPGRGLGGGKITNICSERGQDRAKGGPRGPKMGPRRAIGGPRWPQGGKKGGQEDPKRALRGPKGG